MKIDIEDIVTLRDICEELKFKKSKINYYTLLGLLIPFKHLSGNTYIFDKKDVEKRMKFIEKEQNKGKTLKVIAEELRIKNKQK